MKTKILRRDRSCSRQIHQPCPLEVGGGLPRFSKPLGLDFIITPEGRGVLIELQHGFGRRGLLMLFPAANRSYRRRFRSLLRENGVCFELLSGLRRLCNDKIRTYEHFAHYQAPSFAFNGWSPKVERWLEGLDAEVLLAKPPQESCGRGIVVVGRQALLAAAGAVKLPTPALLQSFVPCRPLFDEQGLPHVGCIRHIVVMVSDGERLSFVHLPSYWRVSPVPRSWSLDEPDRDALTANISRGAFPLAVDEGDEVTVRRLTERICAELVGLIFARPSCSLGQVEVITADGEVPLELAAPGA